MGNILGSPPQPPQVTAHAPTFEVAAEAALKVRNQSRKCVEDAWSNLIEEADVQKLVWDSLIISLGPSKTAEFESLNEELQKIINLHFGNHEEEAMVDLKAFVNVHRDEDDHVNDCVIKACQRVIKQGFLSDKRAELSERVHMSGVPALLPRGEEERKMVLGLISECELESFELEQDLKSILNLEESSPDEPETTKEKIKVSLDGDAYTDQKSQEKPIFFTDVTWTSSRLLEDITGMSAAEPRPTLLGDGSPGAMKLKKPAPQSAEEASQLNAAEPKVDITIGDAINRISDLLQIDLLAAAWKQFADEVEVQKLVWQSVSLTKLGPAKKQFVKAAKAVQKEVKEILMLKASDPEAAVQGLMECLQDLVPKGVAESDIVNRPFRRAAQDIIHQHEVREHRKALRSLLLGTPGSSSVSTAVERDELIEKCCLADAALIRGVREFCSIQLVLNESRIHKMVR